MSELEHALRKALADPPTELPNEVREPLWDIEERIHRRRRKQRRNAVVALACAAVAAVVVPLSVYGTPGGSQTYNSDARADHGGGQAAVPAAVRKAAENLASATGAHADRTAEWVRTTVRQWDRLAHTSSTGEATMAVYIVQLRGHFTCSICPLPASATPPTGKAQLAVVPTRRGQHTSGAFGPIKRPYDLRKLGAVHTFSLR